METMIIGACLGAIAGTFLFFEIRLDGDTSRDLLEMAGIGAIVGALLSIVWWIFIPLIILVYAVILLMAPLLIFSLLVKICKTAMKPFI